MVVCGLVKCGGAVPFRGISIITDGLLTDRNAAIQRIITMWFVLQQVAGIITSATLVVVG